MKRPRLRKWAKWACTVAAGLAVALAVLSAFWSTSYSTVSADGDIIVFVTMEEGVVYGGRIADVGMQESAGRSGVQLTRARAWHWGVDGVMVQEHPADGWHPGIRYFRNASQRLMGVNLFYPVLLTTIPAALLWYTDRRRPKPGSCKGCGYDRRGLATDAKCPECGTPTVPTPTK